MTRSWLTDWERTQAEREESRAFVTTYCNRSHRLVDGEPVGHECIRIPPAALAAEREGDFDNAARIMLAERKKSK